MTTQLPIRAERDPRYYYRFLLISAVALGFALWSLYDGAIGYPNQRERALKYQELVKQQSTDEHGEFDFEETQKKQEEWERLATERGWPLEDPGHPKTEADFIVQFIMAGLAGAIGLTMLFYVWQSRGRWIEADETGISSSWGQRVEFASVVLLDKSKWAGKGIAKVTYEDGNRRRKFIIDDYKFYRQATDAILYELEGHVDLDRIVGGPPEPLPGQEEDLAESDVEDSPQAE